MYTADALTIESQEIRRRGKETAKLYEFAVGETLKEITAALLIHPITSEIVKHAITAQQHRYYIFSYPSDGLTIKGYISLPEKTNIPLPLIILLRGGNGLFGLPHPGELSAQSGYALVATTNRGGVSEGKDEFGGADVDDVKNLIDFLPHLEKKLNIQFHCTDKYMIATSRGGMQLFLTLGRYPYLQQQIKKIVSLSGLLNIISAIQDRPDFKTMLQEDFGFTEDEEGTAWLAKRQPLNYVDKIRKDLPILIAQGTHDTRVCLKEGYDMLNALRETEHEVTYIEIEGGDHVLHNTPDFMPLLMDWLAS